jgi:hypothetical protein
MKQLPVGISIALLTGLTVSAQDTASVTARVWAREGNAWKLAAEERTASAPRQPTT